MSYLSVRFRGGGAVTKFGLQAAFDAANALPEAAENPGITVASSPSEAYYGDGDDSGSTPGTPEPAPAPTTPDQPTATTPDRPTATIDDILSNWQAEFSPPKTNHHTPATTSVRGRQTAMI